LKRRSLLSALPAAALAGWFMPGCGRDPGVPSRLNALEHPGGGRLGACLLDAGSGKITGHRLDERFGMCSTFKLPLAAVILQEIDAGRLAAAQPVTFDQSDMVPHAPVTADNLERGEMTVIELAEAAQVSSDNVAANLLLKLIGGPEGFTKMLRALGDDVTRLDRWEPDMNRVPQGELRDTSTPRAMAQTVATIFSGNTLSRESRDRLANWTRSTRSGRKRIRAGLPADWTAGDKTGTARADDMNNKYNDVAVIWRDGGRFYVVAAFYEADGSYEHFRDADQAVLADVGRIATAWIQARG